ncbi:MAG TPA: hypothetical protein VKA03_04440 [Methylovirgula sp.]|nr:hypothetical protein [Methylovirgula sp.]
MAAKTKAPTSAKVGGPEVQSLAADAVRVDNTALADCRASWPARRAVKALRRHVGDPKSSDQMVYAGRVALGAISRRGQEWLAFNLDGRRIGRFETRSAAFSAIIESAGAPAQGGVS